MEPLQVQCSWCGVYKWSDNSWRLKPEFPGLALPISHGICPECLDSIMGELRAIGRTG